MTTPILFLLGAVALSALGGLVVWIASRPRPERFGSTIESFSRDLDALAPPGSAKPAGSSNPKSSEQTPSAHAPHDSRSTSDRPRPGPRPTSRQSGS